MNVAKKSTLISKKQINFLSKFFATIIVLLIVAIICDPKKYINSCYNGLLIWAKNVLPELFPFFFLTKILTELNVLEKFFNKFAKLNKFLFNAPSCSSYIFGMSIISGYPVGAKLIQDFYSKNIISSNEANKLMTFCSTSGPLFIIGTVGTIIFNDIKVGFLIFIAHILSAILNGILYRKLYYEKSSTNFDSEKAINYNEILPKSMNSAISSILVVGGYIAIFFMIIDILNSFQILSPLSFFINKVLSIFNISVGSSISNGIIEVTRGVTDLSKLALSKTQICVISSGLIAFGGLSVNMQALTFLSQCKINTKLYFLQKITQTIFACVISFLLSILFL